MKKMIVAMMVVVCTATGFFANGAVVGERQADEAPLECKITITGTFDGKAIDITVTLQADNCAKAAAQLMKEIIAVK